MNTARERLIHRLLLQREREFTAVWRAECEINKVLGADYPFDAPPALPSARKPSKAKISKPKREKPPKLNALLRNLRDTENAYRVTYECEANTYQGIQSDVTLLRELVPLKTASFKIEKIEAVAYHGKDKLEILEELYMDGMEFEL